MAQTKTKTEIVSDQVNRHVCIKLIEAEGMVKALVLDMAKTENRLLYIGQGQTAREAYRDGLDFVEAMARAGSVEVWQ